MYMYIIKTVIKISTHYFILSLDFSYAARVTGDSLKKLICNIMMLYRQNVVGTSD